MIEQTDMNILNGSPRAYEEVFDDIIETMNVDAVTLDVLGDYMVSLEYPNRRTFKGQDQTTLLFHSANLLKSYMYLYNITIIKQKITINLD